jgi:hypothetical protein
MLRSHQKTNQQVDMTVAKHAKSVRNGPIVEFLWQEVASNLVGSMPLHLPWHMRWEMYRLWRLTNQNSESFDMLIRPDW